MGLDWHSTWLVARVYDGEVPGAGPDVRGTHRIGDDEPEAVGTPYLRRWSCRCVGRYYSMARCR